MENGPVLRARDYTMLRKEGARSELAARFARFRAIVP